MFFMLSGTATLTVFAADGCVIPESGPWPPCATGGASSSNCVIPESGPWPPCATRGGGANAPAQPAGNMATAANTTWIVHQGRGTKQSTILVQGVQDDRRIATVEVEIDFTYAASTCHVSNQLVEKDVLGYALVSPSGTRIDLFEAGDLSGMQSGARAKMRFADGGNRLNHVASGRFQSADSLSQLNGENPLGEWTVIITKQSFDYAVCQHSATLFITTSNQGR